MKFVLYLTAVLAFGQHLVAAAEAQVAPQCRGLDNRAARQDMIRNEFACRRGARPDELRAGGLLWERCARRDKVRMRKAIHQRANQLEACIARQIQQIRQTERRESLQNPNRSQSGARPEPGRTTAGVGTARPRVSEPEPVEPRDNSLERSSGPLANEKLTDLLGRRGDGNASSEGASPQARPGDTQATGQPRLAEGGSGEPTSDNSQAGTLVQGQDLRFRSGLVWSYAGPVEGMHCTQWREPSDPDSWADNYLCAGRDWGFQWSFRGPILGRGLKCIQVREKSDPHDWHDNYFCWPQDLEVTFRFSSTGRISGFECLAIVEPSDPHTWRDNYLCHRPERG